MPRVLPFIRCRTGACGSIVDAPGSRDRDGDVAIPLDERTLASADLRRPTAPCAGFNIRTALGYKRPDPLSAPPREMTGEADDLRRSRASLRSSDRRLLVRIPGNPP
jgi:hypothetical protein